MDAIFYESQVVSNDELNAGIRHLIISPAEKIPYEAGQFFMLRLKDEKGTTVERSYSVANYDDSGQIEFAIRIEKHGQMTSLIDKLVVGDTIDLKGPFGRFGFGALPKDFKKLVLIAGGVGIAPLRSMIQKSFQGNADFPMQLFYGYRNIEDHLFREEFDEYAKDDRFSITSSVSQHTDDTPEINNGYITDYLDGKIFEAHEGTHVCICGPPPMVKSTRAKLFELGFERSNVHVEAW
jgi:NAD(P)H-flavin reductase